MAFMYLFIHFHYVYGNQDYRSSKFSQCKNITIANMLLRFIEYSLFFKMTVQDKHFSIKLFGVNILKKEQRNYMRRSIFNFCPLNIYINLIFSVLFLNSCKNF